MTPLAHVIVIGAGSTGSAIAHDLTLRGLKVTVLERAGVASGSTGHNQAQLHSGARYAVNDPDAARECIQENWILRHIVPNVLELNDGLFIATNDAGMAYRTKFLEACAMCNIPTKELKVADILRIEPLLNPNILTAIQVPDGVFDPYRLCLSFLATAAQHGAVIRTFCEVIGLDIFNRRVTFHSRITGKDETLQGDIIINATGPWVAQVASLGEISVAVEPSAGAMLTLDQRVCQKVINLLDLPGDGDIIVPQRLTSILGTTSWEVEDPTNLPVPEGSIEQIYKVAEQMIPYVRQARIRGMMAAARPLLVMEGVSGRNTTRSFACYDHTTQGAPGFYSVVGGKTTTSRLIAEQVSNQVCAFLGVDIPCGTREFTLVSYRKWSHV